MSIATGAMAGNRRFAQALFASLLVHALAFHGLGDLRPRTPATTEPLPLQVRIAPPPAPEKLAAAAPAPAAPQARAPQARREPVLRAPRPTAPPAPPAVPAPPADAAPAPDLPQPLASSAAPPAAVAPAQPPATSSDPAADQRALQARFGRDIEGAVDAAKSYPRIARERGWQGTVKIRFRFLPGGTLGKVEVVDSSGFPLLDEHAVQMARNADLPPIPGALSAVPFELDVPIRFRLRG